MRIAHLSDSHLGFTAYRKLDLAGYNQRGEDLAAAFVKAIDQIIELRPDILLYTGDLFDNPKPLNRFVALAYEQLFRLKAVHIPVVLVAGNHETPKQKNIGHVFALLDIFEKNKSESTEIIPGGIYAIYKGQYECLKFCDTYFHIVPHCENQQKFAAEYQRVECVKGAVNVGLFHAGVAGVREFRQGDINEQMLSQEFLQEKAFDYCALGHLHRQVEVLPRVWYAGSTERLSLNERDQAKGFLEIILPQGTVKSHEITTRPMKSFDLNMTGLGPLDVQKMIEKTFQEQQLAGQIVRFSITGISVDTYKALDHVQIRKILNDALHGEVVYEKDLVPTVTGTGAVIKGLTEEFLGFCGEQVVTSSLREKGLKYLSEAME